MGNIAGVPSFGWARSVVDAQEWKAMERLSVCGAHSEGSESRDDSEETSTCGAEDSDEEPSAAAPPPALATAITGSSLAQAPMAAIVSKREQESDLLERFPQGTNICDAQQNEVRLVSLGCYCGPKLSFQKMGRGAETLPFDWIRTKFDALLHFMRSDFSGFFHFDTQEFVQDMGSCAFRGPLHSFWHDDPRETSMHERYERRIARFKEIDARTGLVLFVRVASHTGELLRAPELVTELSERFGDGARLLLVLNFQPPGKGAVLVRGMERLMVHLLPSEAHMRGSKNFGTPYVEAVHLALDWALGRPTSARLVPSLEALAAEVKENDWGKSGLGGLVAFEGGGA
mmetsp:Transcript_134272/g.388693  ORF Transcript_134272/g.388693 Transcript_134272/m.388693 type:complete len:344 (+) Transcript_134272:49-1080(+)